MKVALGNRPYDGPWGGGNRFVAALSEALKAQRHTVVHELTDSDIDIILLTDPRVRSPNVCFGAGAILRYLHWKNPNAIVVHRINECDERKGTHTMNARLRLANYCADHTTFIAGWLAKLAVWRDETPTSTVFNGADERIFRRNSARPWDGKETLRIVTHHWGAHSNKGWDVYQKLDELIGSAEWKNRIAFTYIGNVPLGEALKNAVCVRPLDGTELAAALADHHVYITASINEPAGMHHIEGAMTGLPLIYRESGALPEYSAGFGVPFIGLDDFELALRRIMADYPNLAPRMRNYPWTAERMTDEWIALFESLLTERLALVSRRRLLREPWTYMANQIPI